MADSKSGHCDGDFCRHPRNVEIRKLAHKVNYVSQFTFQAEKIMEGNRDKDDKYDDLGILLIHSIRRNPEIAFCIVDELHKIIKADILKSWEIFDDSE